MFVIFVVFGALRSEALVSVGRMQIRHFRRFHQNSPSLAGDKNTVYQKQGLCHPGLCGGIRFPDPFLTSIQHFFASMLPLLNLIFCTS